MNRLFAATSAIAILAALPVMAQNSVGPAPSPNTAAGASSAAVGQAVSQGDRKFINEAASGGMAEVKLGQLAQQKAGDKGVRNFGQRMIDDHQAADAKLKQVAAKIGVTLPTAIDTKDQATYDRLAKLNGAAFDRAYMQDMVADHRKDVAEFQSHSSTVQNPDLRNFVQQTTPTLQQHLAMAQQVQDSLVGAGSSTQSKNQPVRDHDTSRQAHRHATGKSSDNSTTRQLNRNEANRLNTVGD
jgi:putative membrane protein